LIASPIGVVFPGGLSVPQGLTIGQLYPEDSPLAEMLSVNPEWWTATAKAKNSQD
jgi:hypothetical protein